MASLQVYETRSMECIGNQDWPSPTDWPDSDDSLYNSAILSAHYSIRQYRNPPILAITPDDDCYHKAMSLKSAGIPFIIRNHEGWAGFAENWVKVATASDASGNIGLSDINQDKSNAKSSSSPLQHNLVYPSVTETLSSAISTVKKDSLKRSLPFTQNDEGSVDEDSQSRNIIKYPRISSTNAKKSRTTGADADITLNDILSDRNDANRLFCENSKQILKDIGDEEVPVVSPDYDPEDPIKIHMTVRKFLEDVWMKGSSDFYLHQWQFPLSENLQTLNKLCHKNIPTLTLGLDLLQYGHDSCVIDDRIDSPFQYIFMGNRDTYSKMHRDTGGMSIIIAPIFGRKELTLVHRDDGRLLYNCSAPIAHPDCVKYPLAAFIRVWKTVIERGDILVLPPGTYHAARNLEPCLSYSRFHMDCHDLMPFLTSWIANDAPTIHHKEVIWNSCIELIKIVDHQASSQKHRTVQSDMSNGEIILIRDAFSSLSLLRHIIQSVINMNDESNNDNHGLCYSGKRGLQVMDVDVEEWKELLKDVDTSIRQYLVKDLSQRPQVRKLLSKKDTLFVATNTGMVTDPPTTGESRSSSSDLGATLTTSSTRFISAATRRRQEASSLPDIGPRRMFTPTKAPTKSNDDSKEGSDVVLKDKRGCTLAMGTIVSVGLFKEPGTVVGLWTMKEAVNIHYEGFTEIYDEFVSVNDLRDMHGHSLKRSKICENVKVIAQWGEFKDEYLAIIIPIYPWKKGRKSTTAIKSRDNLSSFSMDDDSSIHQQDSISDVASDVLYYGPMVKVRFVESKGESRCYERLFPLSQVLKKRRR